jgi:hypothetical protein
MRGRRQPIQRRAAKHPLRRVIGDEKRQVGPTAGDELGAQLTAPGNTGLTQMSIQGGQVEAIEVTHWTCLPPLISRR